MKQVTLSDEALKRYPDKEGSITISMNMYAGNLRFAFADGAKFAERAHSGEMEKLIDACLCWEEVDGVSQLRDRLDAIKRYRALIDEGQK